MTVTEAAEKYGLTPQAIRNRINLENHRYRIYAKKVKHGRRFVFFIDVEKSKSGLVGVQKQGRNKKT